MYRSMTVIDDFYDDPQEVRRIALGCDYPQPTRYKNYPGLNSRQRLVPEGMDAILSRILGEPVRGVISEISTHCRFRITQESDRSTNCAHADPSELYWVGVIYLSLPEHCQGGTAFYEHKGLGLDRTPTSRDQLAPFGVETLEEFQASEGKKPENWRHLMTIPMRFNRMILYRPWNWHSALAGFGDSLENGRLIQVLACVPG